MLTEMERTERILPNESFSREFPMSKLFARTAIVAILCVVRASAADDADLAPLQGSWKVESAKHGGEEMPADMRGKIVLEFKGNKVIAHEEGRPEDPADFSIDSSKSPKIITVKPQKNNSKEMVGIYKLDGESLTICMSEGGDRPTTFDSPQGSKIMLIVLKREKK
jgi:uncharacterized protein (TIGR03067 family)